MRFVTLLKALHFVLNALSNDYVWCIHTPSDDLFVSKFIFLLVKFPILRVVLDIQKWWKTLSLTIIYHPVFQFCSLNNGW